MCMSRGDSNVFWQLTRRLVGVGNRHSQKKYVEIGVHILHVSQHLITRNKTILSSFGFSFGICVENNSDLPIIRLINSLFCWDISYSGWDKVFSIVHNTKIRLSLKLEHFGKKKVKVLDIFEISFISPDHHHSTLNGRFCLHFFPAKSTKQKWH